MVREASNTTFQVAVSSASLTRLAHDCVDRRVDVWGLIVKQNLNPGLGETAPEFAHLPQFLEMKFFLQSTSVGHTAAIQNFGGPSCLA